ncbi:DEAD/DEAH box helicase [Pedobacter antarcticus]|uniref:DEAD/DEAH box helicase n=1 Tax=Pedobacter antarcticus TaxID=34086 RepID=UPI00088831EA|nr:DEAD/DEAH box helicase family protein [Pedobacter antarcticus]SDM83857.1 type III restriction enzyme [Pedobacter antarcticus]
MLDKRTFITQSLTLKVNPSGYNPLVLKLDEWDRYLDILCKNRLYQKEAIITTLIYLFGGKYTSIEKLVEENYSQNIELRERYKTLSDYHKKIQLPGHLSATLDLATGTGKSFVMYGIAQIALGLGMVDRILILCPSLTIEKGLTDKFNELNNDPYLAGAIPIDAAIKNPTIKDASTTISEGDICIENIHAAYAKAQSSIQDSLGFGKGERCLVLSDEVHHAYNVIDSTNDDAKFIKKWKDFLINNGYGFKYLIGLTGTCYVDNEYFNDVIYRYSLRDAMQSGVVKMVYYASKDEIQNEPNIKYQKIYKNHQDNGSIYNQLKPLTLLVTKDIRIAKQQFVILSEFLAKQEGVTEEEARKKILLVTSAKEHEHNVKIHLPSVDEKENPFEWIISVSMLTEGWDVKNVFQIVPMEERAFNSKLLIAQVLGRGLRLPHLYPNAQVTVYNHDSWSSKIKSLVNEILEYELKIISTVLSKGERAENFHFDLYNIDYIREETLKETKETQVFDYRKETIRLQSQTAEFNTFTEYENINGQTIIKNYNVKKDTEPVAKIVHKIHEEFISRKFEGIALKLKDGEYTTNSIPKETIERIIRNSMEEAKIEGDELTIANKQTILSAFNTLLRKKPKSITFKRKPTPYYLVSSKSRGLESISLGVLRRDASIFYSSDYVNDLTNDDLRVLFEETKEDRDFRGNCIEINEYLFKTPIDLVFSSSSPEEYFIRGLCKKENATIITAWLKSRNQSFYFIEYSLTRQDSTHTKKQQQFNPDFFILIRQDAIEFVVVVEIKADGDDSDENKAKYKYAKDHFSDLNRILESAAIQQRYIFHFLSPGNYTEFFDHLRNGKLVKGEFTSELDNLLDSV